jgi:hypothetical protein
VLFVVLGIGIDIVMRRMQLARLAGMMRGVQMMTMGQMRMMRGRLVLAALMGIGGMFVMLGGLGVGFRGLAVMLGDLLGMRHGTLLRDGRNARVGRIWGSAVAACAAVR